MIIREIQAKTILGSVPQPDPYFGLRYNLNLYRGCQHQCIYCDSRSECYQIEDFNHQVLVKANARELLEKELARKRIKGTIGTGSMNDPYMPLESKIKLTQDVLRIIARYGFGVHIITKSTLVLRDIDLLKAISKRYAAVTFTITTVDDGLSRKLEPGAPLSSERFKAIKILADHGIYTGISMMPVLPFIEDTEENITRIVQMAVQAGAKYIIPAFAVTLRDRQRDYFYQKLDEQFPGVRPRYEQTYGASYSCAPLHTAGLKKIFRQACEASRLPIGITPYIPADKAVQPGLGI